MAKEKIKALELLKENGYFLERTKGNHDVYKDDKGNMIPVKRGHFTEDTLRYIEKEIQRGK